MKRIVLILAMVILATSAFAQNPAVRLGGNVRIGASWGQISSSSFPAGSDAQCLIKDATTVLGIRWATCSAGSSITAKTCPAGQKLTAVSAFGVFTCDVDLLGSVDGLNILPLSVSTQNLKVTGLASGCAEYDGNGNLLSRGAACNVGPFAQFHSIDIESPLVGDSGRFGKKFWSSSSLVNASCDTDTGTVTLNLEIRSDPNSSGTEALSGPIVCNASGSAPAVIAVSSVPSGSYVSPTISSISGTPTLVRVNFYTN